MRKQDFILVFIMLFHCSTSFSQLHVGRIGVTFDENKFELDYQQLKKWYTGCSIGDLPFAENKTIKLTLNDSVNNNVINPNTLFYNNRITSNIHNNILYNYNTNFTVDISGFNIETNSISARNNSKIVFKNLII